MNPIFPIITFAITALAIPVIRGAQAAHDRHEQQQRDQEASRNRAVQAEQERRNDDRAHPHDVVFRESTAMTAELTPSRQALSAAQRETDEAKTELALAAGPAHIGLQLHLRQAVLVVLSIVVVFGFGLAIETFLALNNNELAIAPVLKGFVAGGLELLVAFGVTRLLHRPRAKELRWLAELLMLGATLTVVCTYLAIYSPQRSAQQDGPKIDMDRRVLALDKSTNQPPAVIDAAQDQLSADVSRMHRAEDSDTVFAVAIPIVELLTAELAFEGLVDMLEIKRRRKAQARVKAGQAAVESLQTDIAVIQNGWALRTVDRLRDLGIHDLPGYVGGNRQATPPALPPAGQTPPAGPAPAPDVPAPPTNVPEAVAPAAGPGVIDLDDFAPPPNPQPGIGPEWDLAG